MFEPRSSSLFPESSRFVVCNEWLLHDNVDLTRLFLGAFGAWRSKGRPGSGGGGRCTRREQLGNRTCLWKQGECGCSVILTLDWFTYMGLGASRVLLPIHLVMRVLCQRVVSRVLYRALWNPRTRTSDLPDRRKEDECWRRAAIRLWSTKGSSRGGGNWRRRPGISDSRQ